MATMIRIADKELQKISSEIDSLSHKHKISPEKILKLIKKQKVPVSIFNDKLSPLETIVKYLKEERHKTLTEISKLLNKKVSVVWLAYNNSKKKYPERLKETQSPYEIPINKLYSKKLSLLERICVFLKEQYNLTYHEIGFLLKRNERTIWTTYQRAKKRT